MTAIVALGPLLAIPIVVWLLMEFGPERSVLLAVYWIVPSVIFAIAVPLLRRRGRSLARAAAMGAAWGIGITVAVIAVGLVLYTPMARAMAPVAGAQQSDTTVRTPAAGSASRTAILDAVRARLGVKSRFKVGHIRATDRWAFVRCVEVVADGENLQETDLDVAALLERRPSTGGRQQWQVVELWTLSTDDEKPYTPFARRVRERAKTGRLPATLFPSGFLSSDVPVE